MMLKSNYDFNIFVFMIFIDNPIFDGLVESGNKCLLYFAVFSRSSFPVAVALLIFAAKWGGAAWSEFTW